MGREKEGVEASGDPRWDSGIPRFGSARHLACLALAVGAIAAVVAWTVATVAAVGTVAITRGLLAAAAVAVAGAVVGVASGWAFDRGIERVYLAKSPFGRTGRKA